MANLPYTMNIQMSEDFLSEFRRWSAEITDQILLEIHKDFNKYGIKGPALSIGNDNQQKNAACGDNSKPDLSDLEKTNNYIQTLTEYELALVYKAAYLNGMRIDRAEGIIQKGKP